MKEYLKGLATGAVIGVVGLTTVFAAGNIKSATFNDNQVIYNGQTLSLSQPMVSVVKEGEKNASNYMPVRAVLEAMGYTVDWDSSKNAVVINGNGITKTFDPETEKEIQEVVKSINEGMIVELPEIAQAIEEIKNKPGYDVIEETLRRLDPITLTLLTAEDYQVWLEGGESLFEDFWKILEQY